MLTAKKKKQDNARVFLKPGRNNKEDRENFIRFWARYVREHDDKDWSKQQNVIINSQLKA